MKEFKLPEKWKVRDCEIVSKYASEKWKKDIFMGSYIGFYCESPGNFNFFNPPKAELDFYTEITLEEFKEHVLNEYKLPERWCVNQDRQVVCDYFNEIYKAVFSDTSGIYYLHNNIIDGCRQNEGKPFNGYTKISFAQFEKYVLKKQSTIDYSYIEIILNKLNIK
jgi:hypothetical protein